MGHGIPTCKICGRDLRGLEDPNETIRRADNGELKGCCPVHDWQDIPLADQQALAEVARKKLDRLSGR